MQAQSIEAQRILSVLKMAQLGKFDCRLEEHEFSGDFKHISAEINSLLDRFSLKNEDFSWESDRRFVETVLNKMPIDVAILDINKKYVFLNETAVRDSEMRNWLIGKDEFDYCRRKGIDSTMAEERNAAFEEIKKSLKSIEIRQDIVQEDGSTRAFLRRIAPMLDEDGRLIYFLGYGLEITSLIQKEEALSKQNLALEKANRELDQFVYRTSHEIRGPINSIEGLLDILDLQSPSLKIINYLKLIRKSVVKLDAFIEEIVSYSNNANSPIRNDAIELELLVSSTWDSIRNLPNQSQINFGFQNQLDFQLYGDELRIRMLMHGLMTNAIKYSDSTKSSQDFSIKAYSENNNLVLEFRDNGIGIVKSSQSELFKMFYRATFASFGSGFGLYVVKDIIDKLKGRIEFESEAGEGTTFWAYIPIEKIESTDFQ